MAAVAAPREAHISVPRARLNEFYNKYLNLVETFYCVSLEPSDASDGVVVPFRVRFNYVPDGQHSENEVISMIQNYVESSLVGAGGGGGGGGGGGRDADGGGGEDSSYDSDHEPDEGGHRAASRTPSDTLAAEFAEHVTLATPAHAQLQCARRLGYSERSALAALRRLGPDAPHGELVAELARLAAAEVDAAEPPPSPPPPPPVDKLRPVIVDGSNVAMSHGNKEVFSSRGIEICVEWFRARGHTDITVFVPMWRKELRADNAVSDRDVLERLERERVLVYTPSRLLGGKRLVCYDDRYVLRLAADTDGVVVSNDNYRDLADENADFRRVLEERLLMYTFVNDRFMPPEDPLGRAGPTLDAFLSARELPPACPYDRKCTYGNKCKYYHPERAGRPHRSVGRPRHHAHHTLSLPPPPADASKKPLARAHTAAPRLPDAALASHFDRAQMQPNPHRKLARQPTPSRAAHAHAAAARVASAPAGPAPAQAAGGGGVPACASESALPLWEARRRMHYHLSGIFPEAQVSEAMAAFPEETDAQSMCAIILARYRRELLDYRR